MNREFLYIRSVDGVVEIMAFKGQAALTFSRSPDQAVMLARDLLNAASEARAFLLGSGTVVPFQSGEQSLKVHGEGLVTLGHGVEPSLDPGDPGVSDS